MDEVRQWLGQAIDLVDHDDVDPSDRNLRQKALQGRAIEGGTGKRAVVVVGQAPAFVRLALDISLTGLTLGVERKVNVRENGTQRKMTVREVSYRRLADKAVSGDVKALDYLLALENEEHRPGSDLPDAHRSSEKDLAILKPFLIVGGPQTRHHTIFWTRVPGRRSTARASINVQFEALSKDGFRVLGIASWQVGMDHAHAVVGDETELVSVGYAAFLDPLKESAKAALATGSRSRFGNTDRPGDAVHRCAKHVSTQPKEASPSRARSLHWKSGATAITSRA
jgi:hypothetical protein